MAALTRQDMFHPAFYAALFHCRARPEVHDKRPVHREGSFAFEGVSHHVAAPFLARFACNRAGSMPRE